MKNCWRELYLDGKSLREIVKYISKYHVIVGKSVKTAAAAVNTVYGMFGIT
jgi:hypothetical protein